MHTYITLLCFVMLSSLVPIMKQIHTLLVPMVSFKWKTVAEFLEIETDKIEEKLGGNPTGCCEEVFREWLNSDHGVGPKTWSTLIKTLREIKQLAVVCKRIELNLKG